MSFLDWLWTSVTSSAITLAAVAAVWSVVKSRLEKSIQSKFDLKLEEIKSQLRREEQELSAKIAARDQQIAALRDQLLTGMNNRLTALDQRRLKAVEAVWSRANEMWPEKMLCKFMESINTEELLKAAENQNTGNSARQFAEMLWKTSGMESLEKRTLVNERLFVTPIVWATFLALAAVTFYVSAIVIAAKTGAPKDVVKDGKEVLDLVRPALPNFKDFIDKYGVGGLPFLANPLEERLFQELAHSLEGAGADEKREKQAAEILKKVDAFAAQLPNQPTIPEFLRKS